MGEQCKQTKEQTSKWPSTYTANLPEVSYGHQNVPNGHQDVLDMHQEAQNGQT